MPRRYASDEWSEPEQVELVGSTVNVGNVTIAGGEVSLKGNVTLDVGSLVGVRGNLTLSDSKGYIGLVTIGHTPNVAVVGNLTLSDPKTFIGLVSTADPSYTYTRVSSNTTVAALAAAGIFKSIFIGIASTPTITVYDSAVPSGTVVAQFGVNPPIGTYEFNAKVANGLSVDATAAGVVPMITILAK